MNNFDDFAYLQLGVSNSEASSFSTCELAWFFGHHPDMHLEPISMGPALTRGVIGHKALEVLYENIRQEVPYDEAVDAALNVVQQERIEALKASDVDKVEMLNKLYTLIQKYGEHYEDDVKNWEILGVEDFYSLEWQNSASVYLPMRLDLVIYQRGGKFKGEISPVDHKFTNDFWTHWKLSLNSQQPLYVRAIRSTKFKGKLATISRRSILNQIRTRDVKDPQPHDTFKRDFIVPTSEAMQLLFENHLKIARRISVLKRMPGPEVIDVVTAAWGGPNCQFCSFKSLCLVRLEGGNVDNAISADYRKSTYGYPSMEELQSER